MKFDKFKNTDAMFRPAPFWSWNESMDREEMKRQIKEMADKGYGGYFCHSRIGLVTGYLSEEWMEATRLAAEEAGKSGTYVWLYDEDKWPSGYASGELAKEEKHRDRCILMMKKKQVTPEDKILKEFIYDSEDYVVCKHVMPLGDEWFNGTTYVDLMNKDTVKAFLDSTHGKYKEACGEYFGKEIPGIFTDEPCYFMNKYYKDNRFILMRALPWSEGFLAYFKELKGYSLLECIEELFININDYRKTRFDFFDAATRMFLDSFTKQYAQWCSDNNLKLTGHFMGEDTMQLQIEYIGAAMPHYEYMQWPGVDKLSRNITDLVAIKQLTSVTEQLDKERALCESFGCMGQHTSFFHRKWIADWLAVLGINFINQHLSLYSMRGERKRDYPPNFFIQQPWWECEKPFSDYLGRLSYMVTQGKRDVDILLIHPIGTAWSEYTPFEGNKNSLSVIKKLDQEFSELSKGLAARKLDFHYGDEMIMENHAKVENGKLIIGTHSYSTVVLPSLVTLRKNTLNLLQEFMDASKENSIVIISPVPERINGKIYNIQWSERVKVTENIMSAIDILDNKYQDRIMVTNIKNGSNAEKILLQERTAPEDDKYVFIVNTDEATSIDSLISIKNKKNPLVLDLNSGEVLNIPFERQGERIFIRTVFRPAGSLFIYFPKEEIEAKKAPVSLDSGVEFKNELITESTVKSSCCTINEQNIFRLDKVTLTMNGEKVLEDQIVAKAWYDIFYKAEDGTPFTAEYDFDVMNVPDGELFAVIEMPENLDRITLNGFQLEPLKHRGDPLRYDEKKNWKDLSFTKVPFKSYMMQKGRNMLIIEGKKVNNISGIGTHRHVEDFQNHRPTELESIYILGDFSVRDDERKKFYIDDKKVYVNPDDITSSGYPFYAGSISVDYKFNIKEKNNMKLIKLNDVNAACVELYAGGKYVGAKYWSPYIFDVSEFLLEGENVVTVKAYTTLFNLMGPNHIENILERTGVGAYTWVDFTKYTDKYVLLPFGVGSIDILKQI